MRQRGIPDHFRFGWPHRRNRNANAPGNQQRDEPGSRDLRACIWGGRLFQHDRALTRGHDPRDEEEWAPGGRTVERSRIQRTNRSSGEKADLLFRERRRRRTALRSGRRKDRHRDTTVDQVTGARPGKRSRLDSTNRSTRMWWQAKRSRRATLRRFMRDWSPSTTSGQGLRSVQRYVRPAYPAPSCRARRRVETQPGVLAQDD